MDLDDLKKFEILDSQKMYDHIDKLPAQLKDAWEMGKLQPLPQLQGIRSIVVAGMGGSAIGADLLCGYSASISPFPVTVVREYDLPAWVQGPETLVIASSHSGNTEETLSAWAQAQARGCRLMAVTTGGKLESLAQQEGVTCWHFNFNGQPRAAVGYSFGLLLSLFSQIGILPDQSGEVEKAIEAMEEQKDSLQAKVTETHNPAKMLARQMAGRFVAILGSGVLAPVSRRWKGQVSEIAKAWAQFEFLPEADHNTLAGIEKPSEALERLLVILLAGNCDHPRNHLRIELTAKELGVAGISTVVHLAQGESILANLWTALHFGDYVAFYLAMEYGVDPTPITVMDNLKRSLAQAG
jgi:glucose/mannose-6-phosphate isomerase